MKKCYTDKKFGRSALELIGIINEILLDYAREGYDLSLRQLYYQLVSRNIVPNTERSYKNIGNLVSDARLAGYIDWGMIKDRGREMVQCAHWSSPAEIVRACAQQFRIDRWANQPTYVEVMVEKQALEGVLIPVCQAWDVPFTANKGYSSSSALYEAGRRMLMRLERGQRVVVVYLGDHDPSGIDMSRDVLERLQLFAECFEDDDGPPLSVNRIALNMEQIEKLRPPKNPAKLTDSRANGYIQRFGNSSWELDAIEPKKLSKLVHSAIAAEVDDELWQASGEVQEKHRRSLLEVAERLAAQ